MVLGRVVRRLGLGQQVLRQELVDRLRFRLGRDRLVALDARLRSAAIALSARPRPPPALGLGSGSPRPLPPGLGTDQAVGRPGDPGQQRQQAPDSPRSPSPCSAEELSQAIARPTAASPPPARRPDTLDVACQAAGRLVSPLALLLQALHHHPVELAAQIAISLRGSVCRNAAIDGSDSSVESRVDGFDGSSSWMMPDHLGQCRLFESSGVDWLAGRSAARRGSRPASRCPPECRRPRPRNPPVRATCIPACRPRPNCVDIDWSISLPAIALATPKSMTLGTGLPSIERDQDVRWLQVAVDDALLMCVLHRLADGHEQFQPLSGRQPGLVAEPFSGRPLTSSMTKNGCPVGVSPPSSTRAMLGWSIIASAWRSCSNRASTAAESMPVLISLSATLRLTGSVCLATQTSPMPPSPICFRSSYGPIRGPAPSAIGVVGRMGGSPGVDWGPRWPARARLGPSRPGPSLASSAARVEASPPVPVRASVSPGAGRSRKVPAWSWAASKASTLRRGPESAPQELSTTPSARRRAGLDGPHEDVVDEGVPFGHVSPRGTRDFHLQCENWPSCAREMEKSSSRLAQPLEEPARAGPRAIGGAWPIPEGSAASWWLMPAK